jgi:protein ImuB
MSPPDAPWPGRLPAPSPSIVPERPIPARVLDADGREVGLTDRRRLTGDPARVSLDRGPERRVVDWAGPWPADVQWWGRPGAKSRIRLQVLLEDNFAVLLLREGGVNPLWTVEGIYD